MHDVYSINVNIVFEVPRKGFDAFLNAVLFTKNSPLMK